MGNAYDIGDRVRCTASFTDIDGDPADPVAVVAKVQDPTGVESEYEIGDLENPEEGEWYVDVDVDLAGIWHYRFEGTGAIVSAEETSFYVVRTVFDGSGS